MLDDLRNSASDYDFEDDLAESDEADPFGISDIDETGDGRFLGMTAIERMLLAVFGFMNIVAICIALLLATGRIG